jgi:hypothetical protein
MPASIIALMTLIARLLDELLGLCRRNRQAHLANAIDSQSRQDGHQVARGAKLRCFIEAIQQVNELLGRFWHHAAPY